MKKRGASGASLLFVLDGREVRGQKSDAARCRSIRREDADAADLRLDRAEKVGGGCACYRNVAGRLRSLDFGSGLEQVRRDTGPEGHGTHSPMAAFVAGATGRGARYAELPADPIRHLEKGVGS